VTCVLIVSTTRSSPEEFIRDTVQKWLTDNAVRAGVPYTIGKNTFSLRRTAQVEIEKPAPDIVANLGALNNAGARPKARRFDPVTGDPIFEQSELIMIGGAHAEQPRPEDKNVTQAQNTLNQMAPIPNPPLVAEPGTKLSTFEIRWDAVIKPKESKDNPA
jgi:hypothetical protein